MRTMPLGFRHIENYGKSELVIRNVEKLRKSLSNLCKSSTYPENNTAMLRYTTELPPILVKAESVVNSYKTYFPGIIEEQWIKTLDGILSGLVFKGKQLANNSTDVVAHDTEEYYRKTVSSKSAQDVRALISQIYQNCVRFTKSTDVKSKGELLNLLFNAWERKDFVEIECLLQIGANVNGKKREKTLMQIAAESNNAKLFRSILKWKPNSEIIDATGNSLLHIAVNNGSSDIIELLLRSYHDIINKRNDYGETALHFACRDSCFGTVKTLLEHGAIDNAEDNQQVKPGKLTENAEIQALLKKIDCVFDIANRIDEDLMKYMKKNISDPEKRAILNARNNLNKSLQELTLYNAMIYKTRAKELVDFL